MKSKGNFASFLLKTVRVLNNYRAVLAFFIAFAFVFGIRFIVTDVLQPYHVDGIVNGVKHVLRIESDHALEFDPGGWIGLLAMILGTLMIVISIASQSAPKLIDLYMNDWNSLLYIWFITLTFLHNLLTKVAPDSGLSANVNVLLNTLCFLPIATLLSVPYVFYILGYTKTGNVIQSIYRLNLRLVKNLRSPIVNRALDDSDMVSRYQGEMFEYLNQLSDLLKYVTFKEPKVMILQSIGGSVQAYSDIKEYVNPECFKISDRIRTDTSFKTMVDQFGDMETTRTFYEQKAFRLLGDAYIESLNKGEFDLASICAAEITKVGVRAIENKDDELICAVIIRFNTILRFGIKHGLANNEVRNLYNAIFHYTEFITFLVHAKKNDHVREACRYVQIYAAEINRHALLHPPFIFLLDVFAAEMKKILIELSENAWDTQFQYDILRMMLMMDDSPHISEQDASRKVINQGVRVIQVALALYYMRFDKSTFVEAVVDDILVDYRAFGKAAMKEIVESILKRLRASSAKFWEDTDRGTTNMYFSPDKEYLHDFSRLFSEKMRRFFNADASHNEGE